MSQFGQDGIIEAIFDIIKPLNKYFVEFGSAGGTYGGNTAYLRLFGFDGLLIDNSDIPYGNNKSKRIFDVKIHTITAENINSILKQYNVPYWFDFLSIDIDGNDYWVWKSLKYEPRVVCIEANYTIQYYLNIVQSYSPDYVWDGSSKFGASFKALYDLGNKKGYCLVAVTGCDMIFVRKDMIPANVIIEGIDDLEYFCNKEPYNKLAEETIKIEDHLSWDKWMKLGEDHNGHSE